MSRIVSILIALTLVLPLRGVRAQDIPQRIVSMNLCTDELLVRLAEPSRIAALTHFIGKSETSPIYQEVATIPKIGGDIEEVLQYQPDLVLAGFFSKPQAVIFLKQLNIPILMLDVAQDFESVYENIRLLAARLGDENKGEDLINQMESRLAKLSVDQSAMPKRALFYQSSGNVPGAETFQNAILEKLGIQNVAADVGIVGHAHLSMEKLIFEKPELIIFLDLHLSRASIGRELLFHPAIKKGLPDVKSVTLPSRLMNCGSPSLVEAAELLHHRIGELKT